VIEQVVSLSYAVVRKFCRLEAFSDGVIAIIVTPNLIFEVRVPELGDLSMPSVLAGLIGIAPKFISFAVSFFTVAIFWVNHHHFFQRITHTDWKLMSNRFYFTKSGVNG
jgi:uncharacterized membrane protein